MVSTEIVLTKGFSTCVDAVDTDLAQLKWHFSDKGTSVCVQRRDYTIGGKRGKLVRLHRVIMERMLGRKLLVSELVDHVDGNPLNNCRSNLRLATKEQNAWNSKMLSTNTSGYKGVHFDKHIRKWVAQMRINKQIKVLGSFESPEEAFEAYCNAAKTYRGEFARFS